MLAVLEKRAGLNLLGDDVCFDRHGTSRMAARASGRGCL
jgi:hypothetical protein